jgi:serine/threonine protein phosphatase 1
MDRTIVIGDVHGCYFELMALLDEIRVRQDDRLIFVGDLISKGPADGEVIGFVRHRRHCQSVLGNQERLLLRFCYGYPVNLAPAQLRTLKELGPDLGLYIQWAARLPTYIDLGDFLVVHAGIRPGVSLERQAVEDLTELRMLSGCEPECSAGTPWFERYYGKQTVIFGHSVFEAPLVKENAIGIDTGGSLTAVILPERRLVSIPAVKPYAARRGEAECLRA